MSVTVTSKIVAAEDATLSVSGKKVAVAAVPMPLVDITLVVKDLGPGISAANQTKLFSNFMQIRPSTLQKGQGSGLGLALCKAIVELHGGKIGVESEEGCGSSFYFTIRFPVVEQGLNLHDDVESQLVGQNVIVKPHGLSMMTNSCSIAVSPPTSIHSSPVSTRHHSAVKQESFIASAPGVVPEVAADGRLRALVVDDAESNRKMLVALVTRLKVDAVCEENGELAVSTLVADLHLHRLVLMDNLMPVMNGVQAARAMRLAGYPYIIAGVTGNVMEDDVAEYLDAGADTVFAKPVRMNSLKKLLALMEEQGPLSKGATMTLVETTDRMDWVPRSVKSSKVVGSSRV